MARTTRTTISRAAWPRPKPVRPAELGDPCTGFDALLWEDPAFDGEIVDVMATQVTEEDALLDVQLASRDLTVRMVYPSGRRVGRVRPAPAP